LEISRGKFVQFQKPNGRRMCWNLQKTNLKKSDLFALQKSFLLCIMKFYRGKSVNYCGECFHALGLGIFGNREEIYNGKFFIRYNKISRNETTQ
jgi:hypothetical protein